MTRLERTRRCASTALLVPLLALPLASAHAQVEAGRVIDDSTLAPLVGSRVVLETDTAGTWRTVETTQTDAQGLFQFSTHAPGVYRVALVGKSEPMFRGAIDTLAADSMQQREFRLPVVRRSEADAYLASEVERQAQPILAPSSPPDRSEMRLASAAGEVDTEFVVGTEGTIDLSTIHIVSASDPSLADGVQRSLTSRRYHPATIGGIPVRQVVKEHVRTETRVEVRRVP